MTQKFLVLSENLKQEIGMCDVTQEFLLFSTFFTIGHRYVWRDSEISIFPTFFKQVTGMCDVTPLCVWHESFMCVTCLIHVCDMTPLCVWHDSFMCVTWLIHVCDMTHSYVW